MRLRGFPSNRIVPLSGLSVLTSRYSKSSSPCGASIEKSEKRTPLLLTAATCETVSPAAGFAEEACTCDVEELWHCDAGETVLDCSVPCSAALDGDAEDGCSEDGASGCGEFVYDEILVFDEPAAVPESA